LGYGGGYGNSYFFFSFFEDKDKFYDKKLGKNVLMARRALAIGEYRSDFEPTLWEQRKNMDLK